MVTISLVNVLIYHQYIWKDYCHYLDFVLPCVLSMSMCYMIHEGQCNVSKILVAGYADVLYLGADCEHIDVD